MDEQSVIGDPAVTDEYMQSMLATSRVYSMVLLTPGPTPDRPDRQELIWEHGRRNFAFREQGVMNLVGPIIDESDLRGMCILRADQSAAEQIMAGDPAIRAGIFRFEIHPWRSFPGDSLQS
jgi:uncharacterized protein YciI